MSRTSRSPTLVVIGPMPPPYTGQSVAFQTLVEGLADRKISFHLIDLSDHQLERGGSPTARRAARYARVFLQFLIEITRHKSVVYLQLAQSRHGFFRDLVLIAGASLLSTRLVCHLHGGNYDGFYRHQPRWLRNVIRRALLRADAIIILGERLRSMFDFEPQLRPRIRVVPNGLPMQDFQPVSPKLLPTCPTNPIRILYLSNLIESKGYLEVLEAVHLLRRKKIPIQAQFCGAFLANKSDDVRVRSSHHARQLFEDFLRDNHLEADVIYSGVVTGRAKTEALEGAHFLVLPTRYDNEGQPLALIEAMAHGCVVIATDYRAIPDLVVHEESGVLLRIGSASAIVDAISDLVADPEKFTRMSQGAIRRFQAEFTRDRHLDRLLGVLLEDWASRC